MSEGETDGDGLRVMSRDRLTAFSDGVIAVIITIMVLDLRTPHGVTLDALAQLVPGFGGYLLSFVYVAIYWNNHHHLFHLVERVDGALLWANMNLLFWLSLIPFATGWVSVGGLAAVPVATYGASLLMPALAWQVLQRTIMRGQGRDPRQRPLLRRAIGPDLKGRLSPPLYGAGIALAFVDARLADLIYAGVALMWLVPDRRIERTMRRL